MKIVSRLVNRMSSFMEITSQLIEFMSELMKITTLLMKFVIPLMKITSALAKIHSALTKFDIAFVSKSLGTSGSPFGGSVHAPRARPPSGRPCFWLVRALSADPVADRFEIHLQPQLACEGVAGG